MVWVGMSRGRFVGGRNVKVPIGATKKWNKVGDRSTSRDQIAGGDGGEGIMDRE
jgi:hypothetical protein